MRTAVRSPAFVFLAQFLLSLAPAAALGTPAADLLLTGGPIHTADPAQPTAEAVAVRDGRIVYVGSRSGAEAVIGRKTRVIDLGGQALFPGFIDGHVRLLEYARTLHDVDLRDATSFAEIVRRVAQEARRAGPHDWVIGRGWDDTRWVDSTPVRLTDLQEATGTRMVCLIHAADDAIIANVTVLQQAGLDGDVSDPPGGRILRTHGGVLTGVLVDEAADLVRQVMPHDSPADLVPLFREAAESCAAHGITQAQVMDVSPSELPGLVSAAEGREGLPIRIWTAVRCEPSNLSAAIAAGPRRSSGRDRLDVAAVVTPADGGLATWGARLLHPYADDPTDLGYLRTGPDDLVEWVRHSSARGFQPIIEASGDAGVAVALEAISRGVDSTRVGGPTPRVEALGIVSPDDMKRFGHLKTCAVLLPARIAVDRRWIEDRMGVHHLDGLLAPKSLMDAGATVAFGTGAPGYDLNPLLGFYAAVTRQNAEGLPLSGWIPAERITREAALGALTLDAARAAMQDGDGGSITVGKRADFTVLSRDIMTVPEPEILATKATMTLVGGEVVYPPPRKS